MELTLKLPFGSKRGDGAPILGNDAQLLADGLHGKYYHAAINNRLYNFTSATGGIAQIVAATTGGHPTLFNPKGSGRVLSIRRLNVGYVSGNNAPGSLAWNIVENAGADIGPAGAAILTATRVAGTNAAAGGPYDSKAYWSPTTNTFTAAPVFWRPISLSLFTGVAATAVAPFPLFEDYDGDLLILPGAAVCLVTVQATTTSLLRIGLVVEEVDE